MDTEPDGAERGVAINEADFNSFREAWFQFDPESTGFIESSRVNELVTKLRDMESHLGFDVTSRSTYTTRRLATIHARCHDFDVAAVGKSQVLPRSPRSRKRGQNTQIAPAEMGTAIKGIRTVPFTDMLYILSSGLVPKDSLDADGFVRLQLNRSRVEQTMAAIKIQRWARTFKLPEVAAQESSVQAGAAARTRDAAQAGRLVPPMKQGRLVKPVGFNNRITGASGLSGEPLPLHQRRGLSGTHPLTGLKIPDTP